MKKFSVILPSLLADYPGAATKKEQKLVRAITKCLKQSFVDFELIVVADGCNATNFIVSRMLKDDSRLSLLCVERTGLWSNKARNEGIKAAAGEYIIYLDNDDMYGPDHLKIINSGLHIGAQHGMPDWIYSNDLMRHGDKWIERVTDITQYGRCGTSNICHASRLGLTWDKDGYGHDHHFIQQLRKFENNRHAETGQYYVCHIHGAYEI